jgi:hypothetical protein
MPRKKAAEAAITGEDEAFYLTDDEISAATPGTTPLHGTMHVAFSDYCSVPEFTNVQKKNDDDHLLEILPNNVKEMSWEYSGACSPLPCHVQDSSFTFNAEEFNELLYVFKHDYKDEPSLSPHVEMKEKLLEGFYRYARTNYIQMLSTHKTNLHDGLIIAAEHLCDVSKYFLVYKLRRARAENFFELKDTHVSEVQAIGSRIAF